MLRLNPNVRYLAAAFGFGAAVRLLPTLVAWPNPIGFDIPTYYAPVAVYFDPTSAQSWVGLFSEPNYSPLLYVAAYLLARIVPAFLALALLATLLTGFLGAVIFRFLSRASELTARHALLATCFAVLQVPILRMSWDLLKNELALALLLLLLTIQLYSKNDIPKLSCQISLAALLALTHQLTAAAGVVALVILAVSRMAQARRLPLNLLASIVTVIVVIWGGIALAGGRTVFFKPPADTLIFLRFGAEGTAYSPLVNYLAISGSSYPTLVSSWLRLLLFLFLPTLPFFILTGKRVKTFLPFLIATLPGTVGVVVWPTLAPWLWYRWMLLLASFAAIASGLGLIRLLEAAEKRKLQLPTRLGVILLIGVISVGYMVSPAAHPFPLGYVVNAEDLAPYVPTTMQVSSIPLEDTKDVVLTVQHLDGILQPNDVVLVHESLYGWVTLYLTKKTTIVNYNLGTPGEALEYLKGKNYAKAYLLWWIPGFTWHGQTAPSNFEEVFRSGRIALYVYPDQI